jgi:hypothetical protein
MLSANAHLPRFFGYGSLVNRATHNYDNPHPARAHGWRRMWRQTPLRPAAYLTVVPDPGTSIEGLVAGVPDGDWAALDKRERAYDRVPAGKVEARVGGPVAIYTIPAVKHGPTEDEHPILLSYLDVVVQGYLYEFGEAGVADFFDTTDGWESAVLNDRSSPRYSRHQVLTKEERALVDEHLFRLSVRVEER